LKCGKRKSLKLFHHLYNIMQEVLDYIATNSPAVEKHYVLAGIDTFDIKTMDFDEENDPIVERKYQYVQNHNYFDNA
jgi:hypothetical protein